MSTDLYGLRVLGIEGARLKLRVFLVYYDWSDLPTHRTFFLRALWKPFGTEGPLPEAITVEQILDERWVNENARRYIASTRQLSTENYPRNRAIDYATFYYERGGAWQDEEKLVQGDYEVVMAEPRWTEHLSVGLAWGTTSYETEEAPHILTPEEAGPIDLKGASVVLTGKLEMPRADAEKALRAMGATVGSDIGQKTSYLIVGAKPGSKLRKATQQNIPVLSEAVLASLLAAAGSLAEVDHEAEKKKRAAASEAKRAKKAARKARVPAPAKGASLRELSPAKSDKERALIQAAVRWNLGELNKLLGAGQSPDIADGRGLPLLSLMLTQRVQKRDNVKRLAILKALLEAGADPNVMQPKYKDHSAIPLYLALTDFQSQRLVKGLLEAGASLAAVDPKSGQSVIHLAAAEQNDALIQQALAAGAPIGATDRRGNTALHALVGPSWRPLKGAALKALLEAGIEIDAINAAGETAAHLAARYRGKSALTTLKKAGADLEARAEGGATLLHYAAMGKKDSSLSKVDELATLDWLLKNTELPLTVTDDAGDTLLHTAAQMGSDKMVQQLLARGLSADTRNQAGQNALELCKRKKSMALLKAASA